MVIDLNTATTAAAWVGGVGTVGLTLFEVYKYLNDRAKVKISYSFSLEVVGPTEGGQIVKLSRDTSFWSVQVANTGSKDIIVTQVGAIYKKGVRKKVGGVIIARDYFGPVNKFTLVPGDSRSFMLDYKLIHPKNVEVFSVVDATGKVYKKKVKYLNLLN